MPNITAFENELFTTFSTTTNLEGPLKTEIADAIVAAYQAEWNGIVASGTANTPTNRGRFVIRKITRGFLNDHIRAHRNRVQVAALPPVTGIE